jgi:glycosyltransferase involved in cell wall biosynthesis
VGCHNGKVNIDCGDWNRLKHFVSIVIPTTATARRAPLLSRALSSILKNQDEKAIPIIVVNGSKYVPEVLESLKRRRDVRFLYLEEGSATRARLAGREIVDTEFFGILDDDDEYLPGALRTRLNPLIEDGSVEVVVTNGYYHKNNNDAILFPTFSTFGEDPLESLMDYPWLKSGGVLFRTTSVPIGYFEVPPYFEMTYMAMKLALSRKLAFVDIPTYRLYFDSPESLSATDDYLRSEPEALRQCLALNPPTRIKRRLAQKYTSSLHHMSDLQRENGNYAAAWRYHVTSLLSPYGLRHLFYTRRLFPFWRRSDKSKLGSTFNTSA